MSEPIETLLARALRAQRVALQRLEPSAELDTRFEGSLAALRSGRARVARRRRSWMLAAAATVILTGGAGWLAMHTHSSQPPPTVVRNPGVRLASPDAAVLRVQASLGTPLPVNYGLPAAPRHYWVDVGIASDGSLYIERVIPADGEPELPPDDDPDLLTP